MLSTRSFTISSAIKPLLCSSRSLATWTPHTFKPTIPSHHPNPSTSLQNEDPLKYALKQSKPTTTWTKEQISSIYKTPLMHLLYSAQTIHQRFHDPSEIQLCSLLSIKTGGCTEDCKYCPQSSKNATGVKAEKLMPVDEVIEAAKEAKENGSTRFCMGAAWRDMKGRKSGLKKIATMVKAINDMGMESCVTLGMINKEQAQVLKEAGLTAYNHNIDTSREYYPEIITTRTYDERLDTLSKVRESGIKVCSGGIVGLGETEEDRISFLYTLSTLPEHPESVPINRLVPVKGTPLGDNPLHREIKFDDMLRTIATARLLMPTSIVRLSAGRYTMKEPEQVLCFMAGVNAIFTGKRMLTTHCTGWPDDIAMLEKWGLKPMKSFQKTIKNAEAEIQY